MIENVLKNLFSPKEIKLTKGQSFASDGSHLYLIKTGSITGSFGDKTPIKFECKKDEIFGLRELIDPSQKITSLNVLSDCILLSVSHDEFKQMLLKTDKNIMVFLKSLIKQGVY